MLDSVRVCLTGIILLTLTLLAAGSCPVGDIDGDCSVDFLDLQLLAGQWLDDYCMEQPCADIAGDQNIDFTDMARLAYNWHRQGAPIVINEFLASNNTGTPADPVKGELLDEDGRSSDWIELYNQSDQSFNLEGCFLTDDISDLTKWRFPSVTINPGDFLVVFASGKNRAVAGTELHTNFELNATVGEYLGLIGPDGITIAHEYTPTYPTQLTDISYGLAQYATTLVPTGANISYHVPTAQDASLNWTSTSFTASAWDKATTALGFAGTPTESMDIGGPAAAGSFSLSNGVYTVQGDGVDIWDTSDEFHYVYMPLKGDGQMTARIVNMTYTNEWAKAGVMIRESLDAGARHAMEVVTISNGICFQGRTNTNGSTFNNQGVAGAAPYWVRIIRTGNTIAGYYSLNGSNWTQQSTVDIAMPQNVYIGLCLTSHSGGVLCTAQFDNVSTGGSVGGDLKDKMLGVNASLWTRIEFTVDDPGFYDSLTLRMKYEDGFVAYLNGTKVASRNASASPAWNATALSNRPFTDAAAFDDTNLLAFLSLLKPAPQTNVLAIHALNDSAADDEFILQPELIIASNQILPQYFALPTPGSFNSSGVTDIVSNVWISHEHGFYNSDFQVTLSTETLGAEIRYTTDGSTPTITNGTVYTSPLWITETTTLRTVAVKPGYFDSAVETRTYIFVNDVKTQSPSGQAPGPGWPNGSVNNQAINYGMDPDIVNNSQYSGQITTALLQIPSISIVTDLANLFNSSTGIYVNANQDGRSWERPASIELLNPDGSEGFQIDAGLRIRGGYSRSNGNPKHAFRLFFRSEYGKATLDYPLFGNEGTDSFKKMDLRTSQNYSWAFDGSNQNTFVREVWSRDTEREMDQPTTRSRYYHLYLNGQYWGLYQTQERTGADWAETYLGGNSDEYDVIKSKTGEIGMQPTDGNIDMFARFWDIASTGFNGTGNFWKLQCLNTDGTPNPAYEKHLDLDNLIDEMIIEYYTGDRDGPGSLYTGGCNNTIVVANRNELNGWFWVQHDSEHSLGTGENDMVNQTYAQGTLQKFQCDWLHRQMVEDLDYRMFFADSVQKYLFNGGLLTAENSVARINNRANQINMAIIAESARWGDSKTGSPYTKATWETAVNGVRSWISGRIPTLLGQFRGKNWFPAINAPTPNIQSGLVTPGAILYFTGTTGTTYYTTNGTDPRVPAAQSTGGKQVSLIQGDVQTRVFVPTGELIANTGSILAEYWYGISGTAINDLTSNPDYPDNPDQRTNLTTFEIPTDVAENYGARVRGYLHPSISGTYTFWIASDDNSELWLSSDDNPAHRTRICRVDGWTPSRSWDLYSTQKSSGISLLAGHKYYIEAFMKEGGGGDNLSVAWQGPGISRRIIPGQYLSPTSADWTGSSFNDSLWLLGSGGVGYETTGTDYAPYIGLDVKTLMYNKNSTCYIRIPFNVTNTELTSLKLRVRYDDGFIAYLNGREVKRVNFNPTSTATWNSTATSPGHANSLAVQFEEFDISQYIYALRSGSNILAIQGLNVSADNSDFLIDAELIGVEISQGDIHPSAQQFTTPITINQTMKVKARCFTGIWSALTEMVLATQDLTDKLRISEIMYHPTDTGDPEDPNKEFIELTNVGASTIDLYMVRFTNGVDFTFPRMDLAPGQSTVVVRNIDAFEAEYGTGINIAGQYTGNLNNAGERIALVDALGSSILNFRYKDSWRPITDGGGFSLTIIDAGNPDPNSWDSKDSWRSSAVLGGSPGWDDNGLIPDPGAVVINEVLAHAHAEAPDWIELHNTTGQPIDIGGWYLSDSDADDISRMKYRIADGTSIPANGYIVFYSDLQFENPADLGTIIPFALSENGEQVVLTSGQGDVLTGYRDYEDFGASPRGIAFGRYQKSDGEFNFVLMSANTPGVPNTYPLVGPIVINEIMYNPISGNQDEEYIELHNITAAPVMLYDYTMSEPWKFTDGIKLTFPSSLPITIPANGYLLVVKDLAAYITKYGMPPAGVLMIAYDSGSLANEGEKLELSMSGDVDLADVRYYIRIDRVNYSDGSHPAGGDPWPTQANGGGASLSRIEPADYGNDVANWRAWTPSPGAANP